MSLLLGGTMKFKFIGRSFLGLALTLIITGCFTLPSSQGARRSGGINPPDVTGRRLIGSDENGSYSFLLNEDGTLEYTVNDTVYHGTWSFNGSRQMYPYTFDWTEGDKKQGYIMDFLEIGEKISVSGYWYLTDAFISFSKDVTFEE
jgi:hypothetical protein